MQKTLLIYARICPLPSKFSIEIFNEMNNYENITSLVLDGSKPFDHLQEQKRLQEFDNIILLFPINWFNLPWNLSRYMAEVWRVGDFNLEGKQISLIVTTGSPTKIYTDEGFGWDVKSYLNNFYSVAKRLKATVKELKVFYGCASKEPIDQDFQDFKQEIKEWYNKEINH